MKRNSYPEEAQRANLKDLMSEPPMTLEEHQSVQEQRVAARRKMEDMRMRRAMDDIE